MNLAKAAISGVKRFIFISTEKYLEKKQFLTSFKNDDILRPQDPYSVSKAEAEEGLKKIENSRNGNCTNQTAFSFWKWRKRKFKKSNKFNKTSHSTAFKTIKIKEAW